MQIIAHGVNNPDLAKIALKKGVDFLEIDVSKRILLSKFIAQHNGLKGILGIGHILEQLLTKETKNKAFLDLKPFKSFSFTEKLSQLLTKLKIEKVKICGHNWQMVSTLSKNNNLLPFYTLKTKNHLRTIKKIMPKLKKPAGFSVYYNLIDEDFMREFKNKTTEIWAWTVNDIKEAKRLNNLGVDGIITDEWGILPRSAK